MLRDDSADRPRLARFIHSSGGLANVDGDPAGFMHGPEPPSGKHPLARVENAAAD